MFKLNQNRVVVQNKNVYKVEGEKSRLFSYCLSIIYIPFTINKKESALELRS
jgi:hypothetical protein